MRCLLCRCGDFLPEYRIIKQNSIFEETEKRSKFISYSFKVENENQVQYFLKNVKSMHWSAKHHVYAYSLLENNLERFSDDNEPSGTAGAPILNAIKSNNLKNILIVVVRYFGGILLGKSGLRKAYESGAENVIAKSGFSDVFLCKKAKIDLDYKDYSKILRILDSRAKILSTNFLDKIKIEFCSKIDDFELIKSEISNTLKSENSVKNLNDLYFSI